MAKQSMVNIALNRGLARTMIGDDLRHERILSTNFQSDGRLRPEQAQRLMAAIPITRGVVGTITAGQIGERVRLPQPGMIETIAVNLDVAPTSGVLIVTVRGRSATRAAFDIASVTVPIGVSYPDVAMPLQPVPAGLWLSFHAGSPNGASGLSITVAFRGEA
ncbi:MAG: hypothetical protein WBA46_06375 [Thermomicrobiales bacterium]